MNYLALARKWRPRTFSQLVGQEHVNKALIKSLNQQRLHHAYLFTGTRGVGKTSVARLLAKALNCEQGVSAEPCLSCTACLAIEQGRFLDLIEIDGASKTRVEDTRELLENVVYAPTSGRYKIYLIDEVHMLSAHSFNALLKTLEEPPLHVKFLLATTEPQKLPIPVLSRCLQFNLKHLNPETIIAQLSLILEEEQLCYENEALGLIATAAQGSMRDALSLLDQAIASSDSLQACDIRSMLGYSQQNYALQLLLALAKQDARELLQICHQVTENGGYFSYVLNELLSYLHQTTLCYHLKNDSLTPFPAEIQQLSTQLTPEEVQLFYHIGLKGLDELLLSPIMSMGFEMILLRMFSFKPASPSAPPVLAYQVSPVPPQEAPIPQSAPLPNPTPKPPLDISESPLNWNEILPHLKLSGLTQTAAENAELLKKEDREVSLKIAKGHQSLFTSTVIERIEQALSHYFQEKNKLKLILDEKISASPAQIKQEKNQQVLQEAKDSLDSDSFFQHLKEEFSGEIL